MLKLFSAGLALFGLLMAASAAPTRVSGSEQQKKLVKMVKPVYPPDAKAKGIQGTVKLQAVIARNGAVKELKVVGGPEELVPPSVEAVKQWVYEPTLKDGEPVEVVADIDVNYTLKK
jgi:protein TonB